MRTQGSKHGFAALLAAASLGVYLAEPAIGGGVLAPASLSPGDPAPLQMTHSTGSYAYLQGELEGAAFQALRVPYGAGRRSMLIVLPEPSANFGRFVAAITPQELNRWTAQLRPSFGRVSLPLLAPQEGALARAPLAALGIDALNGDGAGAPTAESFGFGRAADLSRPFTMTVDHPFFYAIEDNKTNELLFVGVAMAST